MYRNSKNEFGIRPTLYRTTDEIREDMRDINENIHVAAERLNPRTLLTDIINDERCGNPKEFLITLEDTLARAQDAYSELRSLREELISLEDELRETLCEMGY